MSPLPEDIRNTLRAGYETHVALLEALGVPQEEIPSLAQYAFAMLNPQQTEATRPDGMHFHEANPDDLAQG